jgi:hypothetical protein
MGSCAAPSAKGDDKFITTDYLQQCRSELAQELAGPDFASGHRRGTTENIRPVRNDKILPGFSTYQLA